MAQSTMQMQEDYDASAQGTADHLDKCAAMARLTYVRSK